MAYSIHNAITDTTAHLESIKLIAAKYDNAYQTELCDGRRVWVYRDVKPTGFSLHTDGDVIRAYPFELVGGVARVYSGAYVHAPIFLERLDPTLYSQLLAAMLKES